MVILEDDVSRVKLSDKASGSAGNKMSNVKRSVGICHADSSNWITVIYVFLQESVSTVTYNMHVPVPF